MRYCTLIGGYFLIGFFIGSVAYADADPDEPIACKKLVIKHESKFKLRCDIDQLPSPENAPSNESGNVANLAIVNVGVGITGQGFSSAWRALGPNGVRGYKSPRRLPTCRVRLSNRRLIVLCREASTATSTQLPVPDRLNIRFQTFGATTADSKTYCLTTADGTILENSGSKLVVKNMPAPADCTFFP